LKLNKILLFVAIFWWGFSLASAEEDIPLPEGTQRIASSLVIPSLQGADAQKDNPFSTTYKVNLPLEKVREFYKEKISSHKLINDSVNPDGSQLYVWQEGGRTYSLLIMAYPLNNSESLLIYTQPKDKTKTEEQVLSLKRQEEQLAFSAKREWIENYLADGKKVRSEYYSTPLPFSRVIQHYKEKLRSQGWQLLMVAGQEEEQLLFTRSGECLSLNKAREEAGRTEFLLVYSEMASQEDKPPKEPNFLAVEPSLKRINYLQDPQAKQIYAYYKTEKNYEEIVRFYKYQMQALGWDLSAQQERQLQELLDNSLFASVKAKPENKVMKMDFTSSLGKCKVMIMERPDKVTMVQITYEAK